MDEDDHQLAVLDRDDAERLGMMICAGAARQAQATCRLLELIGEFDAGHGWAYSDGVKSIAHWLSWACGMSAGTAREHVRVARALRRMPTVLEAFGRGELSYSKVRELTRVVDLVDDARLCELARYATASQVARMIAAFRTAAGTRIQQQQRRRFRLLQRSSDQMVGVSGVLPAEEGGVVMAALTRARDINGTPPKPRSSSATGSEETDATPAYGDADAIRDICQHYLNTVAVDDASGEDRNLVIIEVAAEQLLAVSVSRNNVPAGTPASADVEAAGLDVPAGTLAAPSDGGEVASRAGAASVPPTALRDGIHQLRNDICTVRGAGPIEPATAQRMVCTGTLLGAVVDAHGDVLALGRSRRLVSKAQRRALMVRDRSCQFPGCSRDKHLEAHHVVAWSHGGATDLDNLILLCRWHHTAVHEGGILISRIAEQSYPAAQTCSSGWAFRLPDGEPVAATGWRVMSADRLGRELTYQSVRNGQINGNDDGARDSDEAHARSIRTIGGGAGFQLAECVRVLFDITLDQDQQAA